MPEPQCLSCEFQRQEREKEEAKYQQASWQPVPNNENASIYHWDAVKGNPNNHNWLTTRMLVNSYNPEESIVVDLTIDCLSNSPSMKINQVDSYREQFAQGDHYDTQEQFPTQFETIDPISGEPFLYIYNHFCR